MILALDRYPGSVRTNGNNYIPIDNAERYVVYHNHFLESEVRGNGANRKNKTRPDFEN